MAEDSAMTPAMRRIAHALADIAAPDELRFALEERKLVAADLFHVGTPPAAILRPRDQETLIRCIAAACSAGLPVIPRGGGISYSAGYVTDRTGALMVDMRGLNAVLHTDLERETVTVQAGCTWKELDDHLQALGHRACFRGTASGRDATIGGSLSQEAVLLGSGRFGTAGNTVERLVVLTAEGTTIIAQRGSGIEPDAFIGDCGALGIKLEATVSIMQRPAGVTYAARCFTDGGAAIAAQARVGSAGIASECFLFDRAWSSRRLDGDDAASGWVESAPGHRHRPDANWELHAAFEGASIDDARSARASFNAICRDLDGQDAGEGVIGHLHHHPFGPPTLLFGPQGKRWVPLHFVISHDRHADMGDAIVATMHAHWAAIGRHGIEWHWSSLLVGRDHVLLEPSLYWPDSQPSQVAAYFDAETLARVSRLPADPQARAAIDALRSDLIRAGQRIGARHIQLGRLYPPEAAFAAWSIDELRERKRILDPQGLMNPGVLGLE